MFCSKCGANLGEGVKFCPSCGAPVGPVSATPAPADAPGAAAPAPTTVHPKRRAPFVIIVVAAVAVVAIAAFAVTHLLGGNPKEAAGANGMGNSVTNIAVGEGQAVSAGGMDYFFDGNGLECAKANDPGSVKQICSISSDGTSVGMLNYADSYLFYVQEEDSSYDIKSVKADGSDEETLYSLDVDAGHNNFPRLYIVDGRIYIVYLHEQNATHNQNAADSLRIVSMATDGSDVRNELDFDMSSITSRHCVALSGGRVYYSDDEADDDSTGGSSVYSMKIDGSDTKRIFSSDGGSVGDITVVGDRVLVAAHDHSGGYGPNGTYSYYVTSMNTDGSDAKKITDVSSDEIHIVGANNDTVYLAWAVEGDYPDTFVGSWHAVPAAGGDETDFELPDSFDFDSSLIGADDHIIVNDGSITNDLSYNDGVGSMKADGSSYVEYFS